VRGGTCPADSTAAPACCLHAHASAPPPPCVPAPAHAPTISPPSPLPPPPAQAARPWTGSVHAQHSLCRPVWRQAVPAALPAGTAGRRPASIWARLHRAPHRRRLHQVGEASCPDGRKAPGGGRAAQRGGASACLRHDPTGAHPSAGLLVGCPPCGAARPPLPPPSPHTPTRAHLHTPPAPPPPPHTHTHACAPCCLQAALHAGPCGGRRGRSAALRPARQPPAGGAPVPGGTSEGARHPGRRWVAASAAAVAAASAVAVVAAAAAAAATGAVVAVAAAAAASFNASSCFFCCQTQRTPWPLRLHPPPPPPPVCSRADPPCRWQHEPLCHPAPGPDRALQLQPAARAGQAAAGTDCPGPGPRGGRGGAGAGRRPQRQHGGCPSAARQLPGRQRALAGGRAPAASLLRPCMAVRPRTLYLPTRGEERGGRRGGWLGGKKRGWGCR
jgi:hypothetical protein